MNWINNYWQLEEEINEIEWDIKRSQLELKRWEERGDLFERNSFQTSFENQQRVTHSIQSLKDLLEEKKKLKVELMDLINNFKGLDNKIIKMKYLDGMKLEEVAEQLNYSISHVKKRHAELMRIAKFAESMKGVVKP